MKTSDFFYELPEELIAQAPLKERDGCRLLRLRRDSEEVEHKIFSDIKTYFKPGDRLVLNDTKVIPARIFVLKGNGVRIELLFTRKLSPDLWEIIAKPAKRLKVGTIVFPEKDSGIKFSVVKINDDGSRVLSTANGSSYSIDEALHKFGAMPLPPYIKRNATGNDIEDYQTVFAKKEGAIAAPTAGLHFTPELLHQLEEIGVEISRLTLHVGIGTFRPVKEENPKDHPMHHELFTLSEKTTDEINRTKKNGKRIIAVGTTVVRTLEHCSLSGKLIPESGSTNLFILPGFRFNTVDAIITNFHLPSSTLLMLISAFAGREKVLSAYKEAVKKKYRFFSYGDAMLIE